MVSDSRSAQELRAELAGTLVEIRPTDTSSIAHAREHLSVLTKPPGSLGRLEDIATRVCGIQATRHPRASKRLIIVCAGDHGVTVEGVSAYPSSVTAQMVVNFLTGGAAINALARTVGAEVWVIDVGVAGPTAIPGNSTRLISRRIRNGTRNMASDAAMSEIEMLQAITVGVQVAADAADKGVDLLGLGEMGIGNTTAASAVTAALVCVPVPQVTGRGTGVDDATFSRKVAVIERALAKHRPRPDRPLDVLQTVGGFEIAALCGICLGAAARRLVILTDGFIATSAALVAVTLCPTVSDYLFAAHLSPEPGHAVQLERLGEHPLFDFGLRLGEGTGAALAMPVIDAACAAFNEMATFESAAVSGPV